MACRRLIGSLMLGGQFITDDASPRRAYDTSDVIWDAGIMWRPSHRTSTELRAGNCYGSMSYTGSFNWQPDPHSSLNLSLYDSVDSVGRALIGNLGNVLDSVLTGLAQIGVRYQFWAVGLLGPRPVE